MNGRRGMLMALMLIATVATAAVAALATGLFFLLRGDDPLGTSHLAAMAVGDAQHLLAHPVAPGAGILLHELAPLLLGHEVVFVGVGCELLTEIGMAIKAGSPFEHTFVISHCNGKAGYLPPRHLYKEGGYEIRSSPFAPQAADLVIKRVLKMLHDL